MGLPSIIFCDDEGPCRRCLLAPKSDHEILNCSSRAELSYTVTGISRHATLGFEEKSSEHLFDISLFSLASSQSDSFAERISCAAQDWVGGT